MIDKWERPDKKPETPTGECGFFIVAVRRKHSGKIYTFGACYLNAFLLQFEYGCSKCDGDEDQCPHSDRDGCPRSGWYSDEPVTDYDRSFDPLLGPDDEFLGWQPYPSFKKD